MLTTRTSNSFCCIVWECPSWATVEFGRLRWSYGWGDALSQLLEDSEGLAVFRGWLQREMPEDLAQLELVLNGHAHTRFDRVVGRPARLRRVRQRPKEGETALQVAEEKGVIVDSAKGGIGRRRIRLRHALRQERRRIR